MTVDWMTAEPNPFLSLTYDITVMQHYFLEFKSIGGITRTQLNNYLGQKKVGVSTNGITEQYNYFNLTRVFRY